MLTFIYRLSISRSRKVRPSWPQIRSKLKSFETFIDADAMVLLYSLDSCELSREHTFRTFGGGAKRLERFWEQSHTPTTSRTIIIFSWVRVTRALYTSVPKCPQMFRNVPYSYYFSYYHYLFVSLGDQSIVHKCPKNFPKCSQMSSQNISKLSIFLLLVIPSSFLYFTYIFDITLD